MSARWQSLLCWVYAAALWWYPDEFRRVFGAEMRVVFADALAEAAGAGRGAVVRLAGRETAGWLAGLLVAHARALSREHARLRQTVVQPSRVQALAAGLPGAVLVTGYWIGLKRPLDERVMLPLALAAGAVFLALGLWATRRGWRHTTWALPALGMLLMIGLIRQFSVDPSVSGWLMWLLAGVGILLAALRVGGSLPRRTWLTLGAMLLIALAQGTVQLTGSNLAQLLEPGQMLMTYYVPRLLPLTIVVLMLVLVPGRWVARWQGVGAMLFVLGPAAILMDVLLDPTYGLRSSPSPMHALLAPILRTLLYGSLLVAAPAGVLLARTAAGQVRVVVVALAVALVAVVVIPLLYWRHQYFDLLPLTMLALGIVAALSAYVTRGPGQLLPAGETVNES